MRGGHCLNVWTKNQQVVSLSTAKSELYATARRIQSVAKDLGSACGLSLYPQKAGQDESRRHAEPVDTRSLQVEEVRHEEGGYDREPRRLDGETVARAEDRSAHENHGTRIRGAQ